MKSLIKFIIYFITLMCLFFIIKHAGDVENKGLKHVFERIWEGDSTEVAK